MAAKNQSN